jgi:hypothetical protein
MNEKRNKKERNEHGNIKQRVETAERNNEGMG